jgi:hypothetical protein
MTKQEMFDTVARHLLTQNERSEEIRKSTVDGTLIPFCSYRGMGGLKCAIGVLIPDEIYRPEMENNGAYSLLEQFPELAAYIPDEDLAHALQYVHDKYQVSDWKMELINVAATHQLDASVVQEFPDKEG